MNSIRLLSILSGLLLAPFFLVANSNPDIFFYDLEVQLNPALQRLAGTNKVHFRAVTDTDELRLDLVSSLKVKRVEANGSQLRFTQAGGEIIIFLPKTLKPGQTSSLSILYGGIPAAIKGKRGIIWGLNDGKPWCGTSPGHQPESWWPCRVRSADPVDSMHLTVITPEHLMAVSQGELNRFGSLPGSLRRWDWRINTRLAPDELSFAVGSYVHFVQQYQRGAQTFPLNYYALSNNKEAAKRTFGDLDVPAMLNCLERFLGPYPFPRSGYAFIESPEPSQGLPGMIPFSRESFESDFGPALLRETSRQWLGFRMKFLDDDAEDLGESLRAFMNVLHIECRYGKDSSDAYLSFLQQGYSSGSTKYRDLAFGVWAWQNLRFQVDNDSLFFGALRLLASRAPREGFDGEMMMDFFEQKLAIPVRPILRQYVFVKELPILGYTWKKKGKKYAFQYKWIGVSPDFNLDIVARRDDQVERIGVSSSLNQMNWTAGDQENLSFDGRRVWYLVKEVKRFD
ncbi:MAG: hypothetical protein AB8F95_18960 [Bacteroidia bacterium]